MLSHWGAPQRAWVVLSPECVLTLKHLPVAMSRMAGSEVAAPGPCRQTTPARCEKLHLRSPWFLCLGFLRCMLQKLGRLRPPENWLHGACKLPCTSCSQGQPAGQVQPSHRVLLVVLHKHAMLAEGPQHIGLTGLKHSESTASSAAFKHAFIRPTKEPQWPPLTSQAASGLCVMPSLIFTQAFSPCRLLPAAL